MGRQRFGACPSWWIRSDVIKEKFTAKSGEIGLNIAALKCIIAMTLHNKFGDYQSKLSTSELEEITGLSRPLVIDGRDKLENLGIIMIEREHTFSYTQTTKSDDTGWAKIPKPLVKSELKQIPNRGRAVLQALKIYLVLLATRPNQTDRFHMSHDKLIEKLGLQSQDVKRSLDILFNHGLIKVGRSLDDAGRSYTANLFVFPGIDDLATVDE